MRVGGATLSSMTGDGSGSEPFAGGRAERFQPERARADFPALAQLVHDRPLAYLDSAATTQMPAAVIDAVAAFGRADRANVHRGVHTLSERATAAYEAARAAVQHFINARDASEIVFVRGTTEAINLVAHSFGRAAIGPGDEVLVTQMEHHSNLVPWQMLCAERQARLRVVPVTAAGELRMGDLDDALGPRTRILAVAHVANAIGTVNPVAAIVERAHARGVPVLVDGAQATAHLPIDVQALGCDFYAFSGHKMLGPMGSGALWGRRELLEAMPPFLAGGEMIREVHLRRSEFNEIPWKFEAGTPAVGDAIGLGVAADYLGGIGMAAVREHERELVAYALPLLEREVPGIELYGPADPDLRGGVIPFNLPGIHPHDVAQVLDRFGVAVRAGHHCTMPLHERLDLAATARASFSVYTTPGDIDALVAGLLEVQRVFGA
jgi:cysteine desulfurase / selenocysteine lyase